MEKDEDCPIGTIIDGCICEEHSLVCGMPCLICAFGYEPEMCEKIPGHCMGFIRKDNKTVVWRRIKK